MASLIESKRKKSKTAHQKQMRLRTTNTDSKALAHFCPKSPQFPFCSSPLLSFLPIVYPPFFPPSFPATFFLLPLQTYILLFYGKHNTLYLGFVLPNTITKYNANLHYFKYRGKTGVKTILVC